MTDLTINITVAAAPAVSIVNTLTIDGSLLALTANRQAFIEREVKDFAVACVRAQTTGRPL